MRGSAIAFVLGKAVVGKGLVDAFTPAIAFDLGQDRSSRNARHFAVAFDNGLGQDILILLLIFFSLLA